MILQIFNKEIKVFYQLH